MFMVVLELPPYRERRERALVLRSWNIWQRYDRHS